MKMARSFARPRRPADARLALAALLFLALGSCKLTTKNTDFLDDFIPALMPAEKVDHVERDIVYASPSGQDLTLDVTWPEGAGPYPVLVWVHGGNYNHFSKESAEGLARAVTNRGYVVFNVNYRKVPSAHLKEIAEDVMGAVNFARDHARDYNGDPARIAVGGHSAGAQLAQTAALAGGDDFFSPVYVGESGRVSEVQAVIVAGGYFEFEPEWGKWNEWLLGASRDEAPELYEKCEPMSRDPAGLPPHLVIFGEEDMHRERGEAWAARLESAGVDAETLMVPGADHHYIMWHWKRPARSAYNGMADFLDRKLKGVDHDGTEQ